ncbi:MAG TPA: hypothetical protein PLC43_02475 [Caldisericia bacterium]|jgi:hypothetical protein|nr:hypothetical protein [Caldisericia bacterium]
MTIVWFSGMTVCGLVSLIIDFGDDSGGHSHNLFLSFPRSLCHSCESGNPGSISSSNVREKNNIDSPLLISGITENENNKEKERKHWIPNQVGDDSGVVFGDDSLCGF